MISQNARSRDSERGSNMLRLIWSVISERTGDHSERINERLSEHSVWSELSERYYRTHPLFTNKPIIRWSNSYYIYIYIYIYIAYLLKSAYKLHNTYLRRFLGWIWHCSNVRRTRAHVFYASIHHLMTACLRLSKQIQSFNLRFLSNAPTRSVAHKEYRNLQSRTLTYIMTII